MNSSSRAARGGPRGLLLTGSSNHSALVDAADLAGLIAELKLGQVHLGRSGGR
jgi:hypothetical protein